MSDDVVLSDDVAWMERNEKGLILMLRVQELLMEKFIMCTMMMSKKTQQEGEMFECSDEVHTRDENAKCFDLSAPSHEPPAVFFIFR